MAEAKKASFSFKKFKVPSFSFKNLDERDIELTLNFNPTGVFSPKKGKYLLTLEFVGYEVGNPDNEILRVKSIAEFRFSNSLEAEEIPSYFYNNSVAIVFPYLRAFISTLTLQSNTGVIMLGLLNFVGMGDDLKKNTTINNE